MKSDILKNLPEVSFVDNITLEEIRNSLLEDYIIGYKMVTGKDITLSKADPMRLLMNACSVMHFQQAMWIDREGKLSLLKYSYGPFLDNLGVFKGVLRNDAQKARTTVRFSIQQERTSVVGIPAGTRVTGGTNIYFETDSYTEISAGELYVDVPCSCQTPGVIGNDVEIGDLDVLVDPVPYIFEVKNISPGAGGSDIEDDDSFGEKIYLAPANFSSAGPEDAYKYFVKKYSQDIKDVEVFSPKECEIDIYFMLAGNALPDEEYMNRVQEYVSQSMIRPETDRVTVKSLQEVNYNVGLTYYINNSDRNNAPAIQSGVEKAVSEYIEWQSGKIGRDINPDKLRELVMAAGAKRVVISEPAYTVTAKTSISRLGTKTVTYGGMEDD